MTRTTMHLTDAQIAWINREASKLGISAAEFMRRVLDAARNAK